MHIGLFCPYPLDVPGGNATAIQRLIAGLQGLGHQTSVWLPDGDSSGRPISDRPATEGGAARPDLVHGFHLLRTGPQAIRAAQDWRVPVVMTLTGTDVNVDLQSPDRRDETLSYLAQADGVVALTERQLENVRQVSGMGLAAAEVIPQSIWVGDAPYRFRALNGLDEAAFVVLLPAGLRRVKAPHLALEAQRLRQVDEPAWELALLGPVLEDDYAGELLDRMEHFPEARWCGPMPQSRMGACYRESDLVLNTSESEGASNTLLEAQSQGVPVLARANAGNRALIEDGVDGLLFETSSELARQVCRLQRDDALREALVEGGLERARQFPTVREEAEAHLRLYQLLL